MIKYFCFNVFLTEIMCYKGNLLIFLQIKIFLHQLKNIYLSILRHCGKIAVLSTSFYVKTQG